VVDQTLHVDNGTTFINATNTLLRLQRDDQGGYAVSHQARLFDDLIMSVAQGAGWVGVVLSNGWVYLLEDSPEGMRTTAATIDVLRDAGFDPLNDSITGIELFDNLVNIHVASALQGTVETYAIEIPSVK